MTVEARHRLSALLISLLFHAALVLLLLYFVLTPPDPPLTGGEGMVVNLGYVDESTGEVQPMSEDVTTDPQPVEPVPVPPTNVQENVVTQEDEITESVKTNENNTTEAKDPTPVTNPATEVKTKVEPQRTVDPRALYKGKNNGSTSQGTSDKGTGDQGSRDGDPNSNNYGKAGIGMSPGSGGLGGTAYLDGRRVSSLPPPEYKVQEEGIVVVEITVDKYGKVIKAVAGQKGSTTTNAYLLERAKQAAMSARFNPDMNGENQVGKIVYNFQLK